MGRQLFAIAAEVSVECAHDECLRGMPARCLLTCYCSDIGNIYVSLQHRFPIVTVPPS